MAHTPCHGLLYAMVYSIYSTMTPCYYRTLPNILWLIRILNWRYPLRVYLEDHNGVLVKWQVLGLRIARSRVQVRPGSWSGRFSLPLWKGRKISTSHLGRNLRFTAWIIAKSHAMGTQGGTPLPCSDHLVRALLGCQTREIVPISWLILSDFQIFSEFFHEFNYFSIPRRFF